MVRLAGNSPIPWIALSLVVGLGAWIRAGGLPLSDWAAGELLISYAGGFMRRGLLGSLFALTDAPLYWATFAQKVAFVLAMAGLAALPLWLSGLQDRAMLAATILFAPGGVVNMLTIALQREQYFDRKEIWFYLLVLVLLMLVRWLSPWGRAIAVAITVMLGTLIHELFFLFFGLPLLALLAEAQWSAQRHQAIGRIAVLILLPGMVFLACILRPGAADNVLAMYGNLRGTDAELMTGGLQAVGWTFDQSAALSRVMFANGSVAFYGLFLALAWTAALLLALMLTRRPILRLLPLWQLTPVLIAMMAGHDWGRWIGLYTLSIPLLLVFGLSLQTQERPRQARWTGWSLSIAAMMLWTLPVTIPHCCSVQRQMPLDGGLLGILDAKAVSEVSRLNPGETRDTAKLLSDAILLGFVASILPSDPDVLSDDALAATYLRQGILSLNLALTGTDPGPLTALAEAILKRAAIERPLLEGAN